jgi:lipoic acid synthetase
MNSTAPTKSGFMLGLGETWEEVIEVMHDLRKHEVDILTIGQYLRPSFQHLPIERYVPLEEFAALKAEGQKMGFRHVESGPLVRSSYHAHEQADRANRERGES